MQLPGWPGGSPAAPTPQMPEAGVHLIPVLGLMQPVAPHRPPAPDRCLAEAHRTDRRRARRERPLAMPSKRGATGACAELHQAPGPRAFARQVRWLPQPRLGRHRWSSLAYERSPRSYPFNGFDGVGFRPGPSILSSTGANAEGRRSPSSLEPRPGSAGHTAVSSSIDPTCCSSSHFFSISVLLRRLSRCWHFLRYGTRHAPGPDECLPAALKHGAASRPSASAARRWPVHASELLGKRGQAGWPEGASGYC